MDGFFWEGDIDKYYLGHQFNEIFKERVYDPFIKDLKDPVVVDIGGNIGVTTYYFSKNASKVYTLEPSREHFEILNRMVQFNKLDNVKTFKKAIYIKDGELPLYHDPDNKTMYSLHSAIGQQFGGKNEKVECITLKTLFDQENIEHVDLLKLDVEGSEIEILSSTSFLEVAPKIDTIIVEYHVWTGRNPNQLFDALKNAGYDVSQIQSSADLFVAQKKK